MTLTLLDHFRGHLVGRGIVRIPGDATAKAAGLHPLFLEPSRGAPAPGDVDAGNVEGDAAAVLTAVGATGIPSPPYESWWDRDHVELIFRFKRAQDFPALEKAIRAEFVDRRNYLTETGLRVIESGEFTRAQRMPSDGKAFTWMTEFWFQTYSGGLGPREQ
jgi:hypothetical protein